MNKTAKALLIPVAAFAVTVTGVSAFNSDILVKAGLDEAQIAAFEEVRELREVGDKEAARDLLIEAGVDMDTMHKVREAMHEYKHEMHDVMETALENDDYDAFLAAIADSPLADIITSKDDFELFKEAHDLKEAGEFEEARAIMEEMGLPAGHHGFGKKGQGEGFGQMMRMGGGHVMHDNDEESEN